MATHAMSIAMANSSEFGMSHSPFYKGYVVMQINSDHIARLVLRLGLEHRAWVCPLDAGPTTFGARRGLLAVIA